VTDDAVRVQGKIMKCATKKDAHSKFIVAWKKTFPWGINAQWMRTEHDNTDEHREKLQHAIVEYEKRYPSTGGARNGSTSTKTPRPSVPPPRPSTIAAASVWTSSSTVSSLSHGILSTTSQGTATRNVFENTTNHSSASRRSTRSKTDYESDSNDEYDDLEENIDEVEDPTELYETHGQEEIEDDQDGNPQSTLYQVIQQMQFNFKEVPTGTASAPTNEGPCKHNGPTGLKPGIAESFTDPFECLAVNGLN